MSNFSKARDIASLNTPSFENKLFYCRFVGKYHDDYEMAARYEDGAEACLNNLSRDKLEALYMLSKASEDSKQYWRGLLRGYERQIVWTQDNIDKLNSMIEEEQRNDEAYDDDIRQLRGMAHE